MTTINQFTAAGFILTAGQTGPVKDKATYKRGEISIFVEGDCVTRVKIGGYGHDYGEPLPVGRFLRTEKWREIR